MLTGVYSRVLLFFILLTGLLSLLNIPGNWYMILPRDQDYFIGIIMAPLFHVDFEHWLGNIFLFIPGCIILYHLYRSEIQFSMAWIYLFSGVMVWLFGEHGYHVGLSGVAIGLCVYILIRTLFSFNIKYFLFSLIYTIIHYNVLASLLVVENGVSSDYHISGAMAGLAVGLYFPFKKG